MRNRLTKVAGQRGFPFAEIYVSQEKGFCTISARVEARPILQATVNPISTWLLLGGCTVQAEHRSRLPPLLDIPEGENSIISWWEEANPGKPRNANRTPLMFAILGGYQGAGKTLLEWEEVNQGELNNGGQTALKYGPSNRDGVVKILLV